MHRVMSRLGADISPSSNHGTANGNLPIRRPTTPLDFVTTASLSVATNYSLLNVKMFRLGLRTAQKTRAAPLRRVVGRRFNSTENKPSWVVDNAFNRERENVKHHAAATSSMLSLSMITQIYNCN